MTSDSSEPNVDVWRRAEGSDIRDRLAGNNQDAAARGVFGVPSFFVDSELFFGNDRLEFVRAALSSKSIQKEALP
ncbi:MULTISPECIES: DsbA family protein [unclassified Cupriavidus]|uniref:DsbA family protein n=1 Tax=unclassified Cupriavidus TaxID=2640874 RepID=UPI003F93587C